MSLINCPECGRQISDQAISCPNCGYPLSYGNNNVNTIIDSNTAPQKKTNNSKKLIILICVFLIILVGFGVVNFLKNRVKDNGLFENYAWGMSHDDISNDLKSKGRETNYIAAEEMLYENIQNYEGMSDVEATIAYKFSNDSLNEVQVFLTFYSTSYTNDDVMEMMKERLNQKYGEGKSPEEGMFVLGYEFDWDTPNSKISLINLKDDMVVLNYNPN